MTDESGAFSRVTMPMIASVGVPTAADPAATGQLLADAVSACSWPLWAQLAELPQDPDAQARAEQIKVDAVADGVIVPPQSLMYVMGVLVKADAGRPDYDAVTTMVFRACSTALDVVHGDSAQVAIMPLDQLRYELMAVMALDPVFTSNPCPDW